MPVSTPTTKEIRDNIVTDIEGEIGQTVPILSKAFIRIFAGALAGVLTLVYKYAAWVARQIFPQTSSEPQLKNQGELVNVNQKSASQAILTADATGTNTTIVYAGFKWIGSNQVVYDTVADVAIAGGVAAIEIKSLESGSVGNLNIDDELQAVSPIGGIDNILTVTGETIQGEDTEDLEDYRDRTIERYQRKPQGGAEIDYIIWQKEVPGVTRAFAFLTSPGIITCYPLVDDDPGGRIPDIAKLTEVENYLKAPTRAPLQARDNLIVAAMTEKDFVIEITNLIPNTQTVKDSIETEIDIYLAAREPLQFPDQIDKKNTISEAELISTAVNAGAQSFDLVLKFATVPISSYTLIYNELATGTVSFL